MVGELVKNALHRTRYGNFFFFKISNKVFVGKVLVYVDTWLGGSPKIRKNEFWKNPCLRLWKKIKWKKPLSYVTMFLKNQKNQSYDIIYNGVSSFPGSFMTRNQIRFFYSEKFQNTNTKTLITTIKNLANTDWNHTVS